MRINTARLRTLFQLLVSIKQRQLTYFSMQVAVIMKPHADGSRDPLNLMTAFGIFPLTRKLQLLKRLEF